MDPEVRQQIEAVLAKYEDAYNKNDATAIAAFYTADAAEVFEKEEAGGSVSSREAIQQRYAAHFASNPSKLSLKLVEVYAIGDDVCAVSEFSPRFRSGKGHRTQIFVNEAGDWKIRMAYTN